MNTLIVPMAGRSSRFPGCRPKWMLTHPRSGRFMGVESITGLNLLRFDEIKFVCLQEHEQEHGFLKGFKEELHENGVGDKSEILLLKDRTSSQSETVATAIRELGVKGSVFVKDSDSYFKYDPGTGGNQVAYFDLSECEAISPGSKSYIQVDSNGMLTNIVEKKVISPFFSVGGYGFESAEEFCLTYDRIQAMDEESEIYISNLIFDMLLFGFKFIGKKVEDYKDWGTIEDWRRYTRQYKCLFIDIDGVLLTNTSQHFSNLGEGRPILDNIEFVGSLRKSGRATVILTTSRSERHRETTEEELKAKGIGYDKLLMGLPHCQRVIINDFSSSNPYPSCSSINLKRDEDQIKNFI